MSGAAAIAVRTMLQAEFMADFEAAINAVMGDGDDNAQVLADLAQGTLPDEARLVRRIGCPQTRQFEVHELGYHLFVVEVPTEANPAPGPWVGRLWLADVLKALAVDVLKANDEGVV